MDAKLCYATAIGLALMASVFLGLMALANASRAGAGGLVAVFDAAVAIVALGASTMFVLAGRSSRSG